jgi:hypothetical protein
MKEFVWINNWENTIEVPTSCLDYANYRFGGSFQESTVDEVKKWDYLHDSVLALTHLPKVRDK